MAPRDRQLVAELLGAPALRRVRDRLVGVLAELGAGDHRRPLVEQADQRAQQPGLALAALAEQDDVVAGDQRPLELRDDGVLEAVQPGPRVAALAERGEQVVAELVAQRSSARGRRRGARRRWTAGELRSRLHATAAGATRPGARGLRCRVASLRAPADLPVRQRRRRTTPAAAGCTAAPRQAATAEELMRSRYAAYAVGRRSTTSSAPGTPAPAAGPATQAGAGADLDGLEVLDTARRARRRDRRGRVRGAVPRRRRRTGVLHERSRFERRAGRWVYVDGDAG